MEAEMLTALAIMAGAFAYIQIGKKWGGWRYASFRQAHRTGVKPVSHLFNFPFTYLLNDCYENSGVLLVNEMSQEDNYKMLFSFVWPLAVAWIPVGIASSALFGILNAFYNPKPALNACLSSLKRLKSGHSTPALPAPETAENDEPDLEDLREELNVALFDQEEAGTRVSALQEKIFVEESRIQGSYREAALPEKKQ